MAGPLFALRSNVETSDWVKRLIEARSHEIVDQALLDIWRRPSLFYMRRMADWELRAWLLGILRRVGGSDSSLGFIRFSRPFLWSDIVEAVSILMRRTILAVGGGSDTEADLRRFFNQYLIRLGEHNGPAPASNPPGAADAAEQVTVKLLQ